MPTIKREERSWKILTTAIKKEMKIKIQCQLMES